MLEIPTILTTVGEPPAEVVVNACEYDPARYGPIIAHNPGRPDERRLVLPPAPDDLDPLVSMAAVPQAAQDAPETPLDLPAVEVPPPPPEPPSADAVAVPAPPGRVPVRKHGHRRR